MLAPTGLDEEAAILNGTDATTGEAHDGGGCRALTVVERRRKPRVLAKPPAGFVAQLIACEARLGAFRRSRLDEADRHVPTYGRREEVHPALRLDRRV